MKKINFIKHLLVVITISAFLFSCSSENSTENILLEDIPVVIKENSVDISKALKIAKKMDFASENGISSKGSSKNTKKVLSTEEVKNEFGVTQFYAINYVGGGFVLLSADDRVYPIIGFSNKNHFSTNEDEYPQNLKFWINDVKKQLTDIQNSDMKQTGDIKKVWGHIQGLLSSNGSLASKVDPVICEEYTEVQTVGPLINTLWSQRGGFNDALHDITCNGANFQVYAGCVPIAMAQVMKYHGYPTSYSWSSMPNTYGTSTTANFIKDIHTAINVTYSGEPIYSCNSTGVHTSKNMGTVLKNEFGYTYADKANYNWNTVTANIDLAKPVILSGSNSSGSGHMWVCDGYKSTSYYYEDCTGISYLQLHMNWGWGNNSNNGYYFFDNFNPANTNYNSNRKMLYNIKP